MRDHYDGTEFDMSDGIDAGHMAIVRCRPLYWELDGKKYAWERRFLPSRLASQLLLDQRTIF